MWTRGAEAARTADLWQSAGRLDSSRQCERERVCVCVPAHSCLQVRGKGALPLGKRIRFTSAGRGTICDREGAKWGGFLVTEGLKSAEAKGYARDRRVSEWENWVTGRGCESERKYMLARLLPRISSIKNASGNYKHNQRVRATGWRGVRWMALGCARQGAIRPSRARPSSPCLPLTATTVPHERARTSTSETNDTTRERNRQVGSMKLWTKATLTTRHAGLWILVYMNVGFSRLPQAILGRLSK